MEVLGIVASVCVLISFMFKNQKKIRCINMIGCILFIVYGILIKSFSVVFLNFCTMIVHIIFFVRGKYGL